MIAVGVIQARMGSSRLPGKVLMDVGGRPALGLMLDRVQQARLDGIVVATSTTPGDDPIAAFVAERGIDVVRGPEHDVLSRYLLVADRFPSDAIVRLTADCPLSDPAIIDAALELHAATEVDYTSNAIIRTFPDGLDVEVVAPRLLRRIDSESHDADEREHVTLRIHRNPDRYRISHLTREPSLGDLRWTLDTIEDLRVINELVAGVDDAVTTPWEEFLVS